MSKMLIEIDPGMHQLYILGTRRHEFAHWVVRRWTFGMTDYTYKCSNIAKMLEEFAVHTYAVKNIRKGLIHTNEYFNFWHFAGELMFYAVVGGAGGAAYWLRQRDKE